MKENAAIYLCGVSRQIMHICYSHKHPIVACRMHARLLSSCREALCQCGLSSEHLLHIPGREVDSTSPQTGVTRKLTSATIKFELGKKKKKQSINQSINVCIADSACVLPY